MPEVTAVDEIRRAVWVHRSGLARMARETGLAAEVLDAFARDRGNLPVAALHALTKEIWGGAVEYNPDLNKLQPSNRALPIKQGPGPAQFVPEPKPILKNAGGPRPHKSAPKDEPKPKRSGWVSRW